MFSYYANVEHDGVMGGSTKTVQNSIKNISRNIRAAFFKLDTRNVHHEKKTKWHQSYHFLDNSCDTGSVFIKIKTPRFYLKQESSTPKDLMRRVEGNQACCKQDPPSHFTGLQMRIFGFSRKEAGAKSVAMAMSQ